LVYLIEVLELPQLAQEPHHPSFHHAIRSGFGSGLLAPEVATVFAFADSVVLIFARLVIHS
jgi:hypothetical protein